MRMARNFRHLGHDRNRAPRHATRTSDRQGSSTSLLRENQEVAAEAMPERTYTDENGVDWTVRAVVPQMAERRLHDRRSQSPPPSWAGERDRRGQPDRRRVRELRAPVRQGFEQGWLVFESADEKRRLAPVPAGWEELPADRLEELGRTAPRTSVRWARLIE